MTATIRVTEAQRDAAQLIVERSARAGKAVRPAVTAIADAASSVGLARRPANQLFASKRRKTA
ncbi:hypothetical protein BH09PAT4_BH09PAT4_09310 [soil metagenome]